MAEPVYPSLEKDEPIPIRFEGISDTPAFENTRPNIVDDELVKRKEEQESEGIRLLTAEERRRQTKEDEEQDTVYFQDGIRKIDFCLTYKDLIDDKKGTEEEVKKSSAKKAVKRKAFLDALEAKGFEFEYQEPKYYDGLLWFVKVHATFPALEEGAEELLIRMPIKEVDLPQRDKAFYRDIFTKMNIRDPFKFFDPQIPDRFKIIDCFTSPYIANQRSDYLGSDNEANFFSSAQRSAIVAHILENTQYGPNEDQVGVSRLVQNSTFTSAFILHDGDFTKKSNQDIQNERQLLHYEWSHPKNFYKYQPLKNIRHYFGEKVGLYFAWVGFYTSWLGMASIVGILIMIAGLFTTSTRFNLPAAEICNEALRDFFYMCPLCDDRCDFWYYQTTCRFAHVSLLFDYGGTVFFAAFMACWAVLFLEFWKRKESQLQYQWDTLGFEEEAERERPEFVQKIKRKKQYHVYNPVLERLEYRQPPHLFWSKVSVGFSILATVGLAVLGVVFAVLIYRLAISTFIYRIIARIPGGPSAADIIVSITGSFIQLIFIVIMNEIYERLAAWLTSWELNRTTTEYENSFTFKMYLFQFINFYSSIFYIAFFKGKFTGYPGGYIRIGQYRLNECSAYGCLLELTIQLAIIFLGKQILNDISELGIPYAKTIIKKLLRYRKEKNKETEEDDFFVRWEKDFEMVPLSIHGLFPEYLELVIQYGFVTIFVAAFPLAPFFAWINNVIEIRLDAHKFIQVFRRPLAERAQNIGAWFHLLRFVTNLCVVTNALLIAVTSQFIDRELFSRAYKDDPIYTNGHGFVSWATSEFFLVDLINSTSKSDFSAFPVYSAQNILEYDGNGNKIKVDGEDQLYLPFLDIDCLKDAGFMMMNHTGYSRTTYERLYRNETFQDLVLRNANPDDSTSAILNYFGDCFNKKTTCRFRGQVNQDGTYPLRYWHLWSAKLAFVIVFEHVIFIIGVLLDWLVPDVPKSVEDEIAREKMLSARIVAKRAQRQLLHFDAANNQAVELFT